MFFNLTKVASNFGTAIVIGLTFALAVPTNSINTVDAKGTLRARTIIANNLASWEESLKNSTWSGTYQIESRDHATILEIKSIDSGFIGAVVTHQNTDGAYLQVKVAGDIIPQYLVDLNNDGQTEWVDRDRLTQETIETTKVKEERLIIRLKRFRALEVKSGKNGYQWHQNREYRLRLIDGKLSGSVGIPPKTYGEGSGTTEEGFMTLQRQ